MQNWSQEAQNATFKAVTNAGFTTENFDLLKGILFFSEPEAAASYTVKSLVADKEIQLQVSKPYLATIASNRVGKG